MSERVMWAAGRSPAFEPARQAMMAEQGWTMLPEATSQRLLPLLLVEHRPDGLVVSSDLPGEHTVWEVIEQVRDMVPGLRVVFLARMGELSEERLAALISLQVYDFLALPFEPGQFVDLLRQPRTYADVRGLQPRLDHTPAESVPVEPSFSCPSGLVVSVVGASGGAGASTLVAAMVNQLGRLPGLRVIAIDLHLTRGDLGLLLGTVPRSGPPPCLSRLLPALVGARLTPERLAEFLVRVPGAPSASLLPGLFDIRYLSRVTPEHVEQIIVAARQQAHVVLVDAGSNPADAATFQAVRSAGRTVLCVGPVLTSRYHARRWLHLLAQLRVDLRGIEVALVGAEPGVTLTARQLAAELRQRAASIPWDRRLALRAGEEGVPLSAARRAGEEPIAHAVQALLERIVPGLFDRARTPRLGRLDRFPAIRALVGRPFNRPKSHANGAGGDPVARGSV